MFQLAVHVHMMEDRQSSDAQSVDSSVFQPPLNKNKTEELGEKMKKIDVKPPTALGLLAKNTALLPSGILRVKQLRDTALPSTAVASSSAGSATGKIRMCYALFLSVYITILISSLRAISDSWRDFTSARPFISPN